MYYIDRKETKGKPWRVSEIRRNVKVYKWGNEYWCVHRDGAPKEKKLGRLVDKIEGKLWIFESMVLYVGGDEDIEIVEGLYATGKEGV